jgi:nitroreductase
MRLQSNIDIIKKRKSIRKYDLTPLDSAMLEQVQAKIMSVKPLYPGIRYSIEISGKTKGRFNVKAPHYLIFGSEEKDGAYENIGFIGQQMDLFFTESGLGSCWLGGAIPDDMEPKFPRVIGMAFGKPTEPLHRDMSGFKRKPLAAISDGTDERLEAARLAPSAMNAQDWSFVAEGGKIHCYRTNPNPLLKSMWSKLGYIDMGIALCHIALCSDDFHFGKVEGVPARKKCEYIGTVG